MLIRDIPKIMIICLLSTILIETLFSFILGVRKKKDYLNIILVNIITNPIVVLVPTILGIYCGLKYRNICLLCLELFTVFIEGFIYKKVLSYDKNNPYVLSLILNLMSYFIGDLLWGLII